MRAQNWPRNVSILRILEDIVEDRVVKLQQVKKVVIEEALRSDGFYLGGFRIKNWDGGDVTS